MGNEKWRYRYVVLCHKRHFLELYRCLHFLIPTVFKFRNRLATYKLQEKRPWKASPFPIKLMNIFWPPKNSAKAEQAECLSLEISGKHPFHFDWNPEGNVSIKKLNVKTLSRPYTKMTHQSFHLWVCHLGMLWTQTEESNLVFQTLPIIIIVGFNV